MTELVTKTDRPGTADGSHHEGVEQQTGDAIALMRLGHIRMRHGMDGIRQTEEVSATKMERQDPQEYEI